MKSIANAGIWHILTTRTLSCQCRFAFHLMLEDYDINGKTILEISKILIHLFVPIPSLGTLKGIYQVMKEQI